MWVSPPDVKDLLAKWRARATRRYPRRIVGASGGTSS